jgi:hypothetical protein
MGRTLRNGTTTEFDPSLLGRAGRTSKKDSNGDGAVDDNDDPGVTTRARSEAEQHQEDRRKQVRNKIPEAPPTPDRAALLLDEEKGRGRPTRGSNPTCIHFGIHDDRCIRFPNHFFCAPCKRWEDDRLVSDQKGPRIKRNSSKYMCQGEHTCWVHPTTLKSSKHHFLLVPDEFSDDDDDDDDDEDILCFGEDDELSDDDDDDDDEQDSSNLLDAPPQQQVAPSPVATNKNISAVSPDENATSRTITANDTVPKSQYDSLLKKYEKLVSDHQRLLLDQECPDKLCLLAINPPSLVRDTEKKKKKRISKFISIVMDRNFSDGGTFQEILKQSIQFLRNEIYSGKLLLFHFIIIHHMI